MFLFLPLSVHYNCNQISYNVIKRQSRFTGERHVIVVRKTFTYII